VGALRVQVVFALPRATHVRELEVAPGTTVREAVQRSGLAEAEPALDLATATFGVWNRRVAPDAPVRDGDRIEVYRPLLVDPKEARRHRAAVRSRRTG
jgi:putative ubiquitin-RnfH superfamily antitoxin RatB of RatAB toxin-antitoxin module